jgi:hypothetical protein
MEIQKHLTWYGDEIERLACRHAKIASGSLTTARSARDRDAA